MEKRTFISFRELFQDKNEPDDRGIDLDNPSFDDYDGVKVVIFAIINDPEKEKFKKVC